MNKSDLAAKIKVLEGLSNEDKSSLLELLHEQKKYGLVWDDKPEDVEQRLKTELPILREVKDRAIISDNPDAPNHILIEGDNLEALTILTYTHTGKIDVIYIDPPYNTGNKDFVYNDKYVDSSDDYKHSTWLSFMDKRLRIAKTLLSDNGVIFISIDDNEQAPLKLLCDEIFSRKFIGNVCWFKKRKGSFLSNKLVSLTEYVLIYGASSDVCLFGGKPSNSESQPIIKRTNSVKPLHFKSGIVRSKLPDGIYKAGLYGNGSSASNLLNDVEVRNGRIVSDFTIEAPFVWGQEFLDAEIANGTEILINTKNFQVRVIRHNNESIKAFPSFIDGRECNATNEDAYENLKEIFNVDKPFSYSKPVNLVQKLILANSYFKTDAVILDFFAGSGTTLHATMQLNAEDGGKRTCIICTNNENGICENVTYERNKRIINGYTTPKGEEVAGLTDNNLRYYRTEFIPAQKTVANMRKLMELSTDMLCIKEDLYTEQPKIFGKTLRKKFARFFDNGNGNRMLIIYDERFVDAIIRLLSTTSKEFQNEGKIKIYVYSMNGYAYKDEFMEVGDFVEPTALPAAIYQAYKKVPRTKKATTVEAIAAEISVDAEAEEAERNLFNIDDEKGGNQ